MTPTPPAKRILVTGGTGFLGRHLVPTLCRAGYAQRILTRNPDAHPWLRQYPHVEVVHGDLTDIASLQRAIEGCHEVVHAAGLFSMWSAAGDFMATNYQGTQNLAHVAIKAHVSRFIYISTIAVIGTPQPNRIIDETHPANPADTYQMSKYRAENVLRHLHAQSDLPLVILRPGAFYGAHGGYAFNRLFFADPMRGIIMQMDGGHYVIFPVYIQDVADAIVLALNNARVGETYNICGEPVTHRYAFDIITELAHLPFPRINMPGFIGLSFARFLELIAIITRREPFYPIGLKSYVFNHWHVSNHKARQQLGFKPTPFYDGASQTIAWYRAGKPATGFIRQCDSDDNPTPDN